MPKIDIHRTWRPGTMLYHPGVYMVPRDMSAEMADRAVRAGVGVMVAPKVVAALPSYRTRRAPETKIIVPEPAADAISDD